MTENLERKPVEITRDALYERVWTTPVTRLAQKFGLPYAELVKICNRLDVPRPSSAYWSNLSLGRSVEKTALPSLREGVPSSITIGQIEKASQEASAETTAILFPSDLGECHPLVARTQKALEKDEHPHHGLCYPCGGRCLRVAVSKELIQRAMILWEVIIRSCEARGWRVKSTKEKWATVVERMP